MWINRSIKLFGKKKLEKAKKGNKMLSHVTEISRTFSGGLRFPLLYFVLGFSVSAKY